MQINTPRFVESHVGSAVTTSEKPLTYHLNFIQGYLKKNFDLNNKTSSAGVTKFHTMYKEKWKGQMQNRKHRV